MALCPAHYLPTSAKIGRKWDRDNALVIAVRRCQHKKKTQGFVVRPVAQLVECLAWSGLRNNSAARRGPRLCKSVRLYIRSNFFGGGILKQEVKQRTCKEN